MASTPSLQAHLSNPHPVTTQHKKLEVTTAANPQILRTGVTDGRSPVCVP